MNGSQIVFSLLAAAIIASKVHADTLHVPTPETASDLLGLEVRMFDGVRKALKDDPIQVEIEFSRVFKVISCDLVIRKAGAPIGAFTANFEKQDSTLKKGHSFVGYSYRLAPSVLAESYLIVSIERSEDYFYVPLLQLIPDRHIDKESRKASPDFRDKVSRIYYRAWPIKPNFQGSSEEEGGKPLDGLPRRKTAKEILEDRGVTFPAGSVIYYGLPTSQIAVQNTEDNLKRIEQIVKELSR